MIPADVGPACALEDRARRVPDSGALVYDGTTTSAARLHADTRALAAALAAGGVCHGDRVAYAGRNSPTLIRTLLACSHLGAIFVPVNFRLTEFEVTRVLADCDPHTVVVEPALRAMSEKLGRRLAVRRWLLVDDDPLALGESPEALDDLPTDGWSCLTAAVDEGGPVPPRARCGVDDIALLVYTSGTAGLPKGVVLTYGNLWWSAANTDLATDSRDGDVHLAVAPMFHIGGLNSLALRTLARDGTVVLRRSFEAGDVLATIRDEHVTTVFGVPAMYAAIARDPGFAAADLTGLRVAVIAGAAVPPLLVELYARRGLLLQQSWGMTETAPAATCMPRDQVLARPSSAGPPMAHTALRLVDPATGVDVTEPDRRGEIWVSGPNVCRGYWRNPLATADAFPEPGWFRTGDIATRDADGYYTICGRSKDMINSGGENIYPAEVERALADVPGISDVAVIGVPDPVWGETVLAAVVCPPGVHVSLDQLRDHASRRLARYKLPRRLVALDELPRNGAGKIDQTVLREWVLLGEHTEVREASG